eukprot:7943724-Pyramimonas_sp.AAC.1
MSSTGKPVAGFFRPLSQMRNGSNHAWSCSIHIVSDSIIVFKDRAGKPKPSLCPEFNLREKVFGSIQQTMSGAQIPSILEASSKFRWDQT